MDEFAMSIAGTVVENVASSLVKALGRRLRDTALGTPEEQAVARAVTAGLAAIGERAQCDTEEERRHLVEEVFARFFREPTPARMLAGSLIGKRIIPAELEELFADLGFDTGTLPGNDFDGAVQAFLAAFDKAASEEALLRPLLQFAEQKEQTQVQRDMRSALRHEGHDRHYLKTLIDKCDPLELSPIDKTNAQAGQPAEPRTLGISDVYTELYLARLSRRPGDDLEAVIRGAAGARDPVPEEWPEKREPILAREAIAAVPRLVVLGQPGGGKSSLVNYLVVQLARRYLDGEGEPLPGWDPARRVLPVRVVLRQFAAWLHEAVRRGDAGHVWDYIEYQLRKWGCKEAYPKLKRDLEEDGGIVFFDGLDEVSERDEAAKRTVIKEAIAAFAGPLAKTQIIVTSRDYAYRKDDAWRLPEDQFPVVDLALFGPEQVEAFVSAWYRAVGPGKGWDERKSLAEAESLARAIRDLTHLRELACYPLLLTLMAQVHGRDGTLPEDRADLYERAVELLLARWENRLVRDESGQWTVAPGLIQRLDLRLDLVRGALSQVAFAAHERQESDRAPSDRGADIPREDLRDELGRELGSVDRADEVIAYIRDRAGLLHQLDNRTYAFAHRTFQEYLAALHLLGTAEHAAELGQRVRRNLAWWREVFLLAAGSAKRTPLVINNLVNDVLSEAPSSGNTVSPKKAREAGLAGEALVETDFIDHVRRERLGRTPEDGPGSYAICLDKVQQWLVTSLRADSTLTARERTDAGITLARLGDPRPEVQDPDEMQFCFVPRGEVWLGSGDVSYDDETVEGGAQLYKLDYGYWMARYPVTNAQFEHFVKDLERPGYTTAEYWAEAQKARVWQEGWVRGRYDDSPRQGPLIWESPYMLPNYPVVGINWYEAVAYTRWLTERWRAAGFIAEDQEVALPSEAEWEKAARGGLEIIRPDLGLGHARCRPAKSALPILDISKDKLIPNDEPKRCFPWGAEFDANRANYAARFFFMTTAVGIFPGGASPYGCEEMSGNVREWTCNLRGDEPYPERLAALKKREALDAPLDKHRVLRGGGFESIGGEVSWFYRDSLGPAVGFKDIGFRVVVRPLL